MTGRSAFLRRRKGERVRGLALTIVGLVSVLAAACGGTSGSSGGPAPQDQALVSQAQRIYSGAQSGLVYAAQLSPDEAAIANASPSMIQPVHSWVGPTQAVHVTPNAKVEAISCAPGTACETSNKALQSLGKQLGVNVEIINADGTPQGFVTAFQTALARNPNAIVANAVADTTVQAQLATAHQRGILTIAGAVQKTASGQQYDEYVTHDTNLHFALLGYSALAMAKGNVHALVIHDTTYPNLDSGATQLQQLLAKCHACSTTAVQWTSPQGQNPVQAQQIVKAALDAHPDTNFVILPYDTIGLGATISAVRQTGKLNHGIQVLAKDAAVPALQSVHAGDLAADPGTDLTWGAWAAMDEVLRGLAHQPLIPQDQQGLPIHLFVPGNTPASGQADLSRYLDYQKQYLSLWGVKG